MLKPPVELLEDGQWRIKGVYEHQVLKAGLRQLSERWCQDQADLLSFPKGSDGRPLMFREKFFRDLLEGSVRLQSLPARDISSAQPDIKHLALPQLLHLRVLHLDYSPSGVGADTVHSVGGTQEAFMATLDSELFRLLGRRAMGLNGEGKTWGSRGRVGVAENADISDVHRLGREAVFLVSAAAAIPAVPWWAWWVTDERRRFFDASKFTSVEHFPRGKDGVLEVTDYSKPDRHEPTGRLRWFDWKVCLVPEECQLSAAPLRPGAESGGQEDGSLGVAGGRGDGGSAEQDGTKSAPMGSGTAAMVSPEVLSGALKGLRSTKTGVPGRLPQAQKVAAGEGK